MGSPRLGIEATSAGIGHITRSTSGGDGLAPSSQLGTLGVYLAQPPDECSILPPPRQWLQVRGQIQPWWVHAQPDDPRSAVDPDLTPLVLVVSELTLVERADVVRQLEL